MFGPGPEVYKGWEEIKLDPVQFGYQTSNLGEATYYPRPLIGKVRGTHLSLKVCVNTDLTEKSL